MSIRIDVSILKRITNVDQERNIYVHPNPVARDIFWQRLEKIYKYITEYTEKNYLVLDFGGGSGIFAKTLCSFFNQVEIVDLDTSCAHNIKNEFKLKNLEIITNDISSFIPKHKYDLIIAADILEHFRELEIPLKFIITNLKENGLLIVSLPTENKLYEVGRKILRKEKPADHYHSSDKVIKFISNCGFKENKKSYVPNYLFPIPLFEIVVFKKLSSS